MDKLTRLIAQIESADLRWAVGQYEDKIYGAVVGKNACEYLGDDMAGTDVGRGGTPYEALNEAFNKRDVVMLSVPIKLSKKDIGKRKG